MTAKTTLSLLVVSVLLSLPAMARAGDINVNTDRVRVSVGSDRGIRIETSGGVITSPGEWQPFYRHQDWEIRNSQLERNAGIIQNARSQRSQTACKWTYRQRKSQTIRSGSGIAQASSSASTTTCR